MGGEVDIDFGELGKVQLAFPLKGLPLGKISLIFQVKMGPANGQRFPRQLYKGFIVLGPLDERDDAVSIEIGSEELCPVGPSR